MTKNRLVLYEEHMLVATLEEQFLFLHDVRNSNQVSSKRKKIGDFDNGGF
jgi:hypothetical protein